MATATMSPSCEPFTCLQIPNGKNPTHTTMASDPTPDSELEVDVVIIGAGLTGIRAAVELHKAGLTIAILDRNNHVGGQCHSTARHRVTTIGDTHTEMLSLAKDFKLDLITQQQHSLGGLLSLQQRYDYMEGGTRVVETVPALENVVWPPEGFQLTPGFEPFSFIGHSEIRKFYNQISKLSEIWLGPEALHLDATSFLEFVKHRPALSELCEQEAHFLTNFLLGVHPDRVSALYVLDHIASGGGLGNLYFHPDSPGGGATHFRVPQGSQAFVNGLLDLLPEGCIHLSTVVNKITQTGLTSKSDIPSHLCKINTSLAIGTNTIPKTFHAKKVLITTPPSSYSPLSSRDPAFISFNPPLPAQKLASINRHSQHHHATFTAVTFYFLKPWWREAGLSGAMDCRVVSPDLDDGLISWVRDTSDDNITHDNAGRKRKNPKRWNLTAFSAAEKGEQVWDWMCEAFLSGGDNDNNDDDDEYLRNFPEKLVWGLADWEEMPVWRHLVRVFGEGRMDSLQEMGVEMPTGTGLRGGKDEVRKEVKGAIPLPISFSIRTWSGMGIPPPRRLPKDEKELEELSKSWKYEGPGKGYSVMRERFGNVHFAGAEIAEKWRGFMEGAARSGIRGAKEVIEALKKGEANDESNGDGEGTRAKL
ncbi:hypothetical protein B0T20DRAFT_458727 [Sordaria brevicollis]|uniref:monoamine oxidase n=1 Tax=Sordaria brevicollis TaxID=83679 RepID=A0AAE0PL41_SORBR|nr:hypothetical protein B0T20DRAFT_458727 [Sordaria brevicollis]